MNCFYHEILSIDYISHQVPIYKSEKRSIKVGVEDSTYLTLPRNQFKYTTQTITLDQDLIAPINQGERVGNLVFSFSNESIATLPLVALEDAPESGFFARIVDTIKLLFR